MSVRNCEEAEEIAKKFLLNRFDFYNIVVDCIDFDGSFFVVDGFNEEKSDVMPEKVRFSVKISRDGNVVGWKLT